MNPIDLRRGEIWWANLDPTHGDEIRKTRPVVIISDDHVGHLRLRIVVPVTDWDQRYAQLQWMVPLAPDSDNGLSKQSAADAFQVRPLSVERLTDRMGSLDDEAIDRLGQKPCT